MRRRLSDFGVGLCLGLCAGALACGGSSAADDAADTAATQSEDTEAGDGDGDGDGECEWTEVARGAEDSQQVRASVLGDEDDDGRDELLFSDCGGRPCVVFSKGIDALPLALDDSIVDAGGVFLTTEGLSDGWWASALEDLDGDGVREIVINDDVYEAQARARIFFSSGGWTGDRIDWLLDQPNSYHSWRVSSVVDLDADGRGELLVKSTYIDEGGGATLRVLTLDPHAKAWPELEADESTLHFTGADHIGEVAAADLNGDGALDLVVGTDADPVGNLAGTGVVVIWGPTSGGSVDMADLIADIDPRGIFIDNGSADLFSARRLSEGADVDGDGIDDVAVWGGQDLWVVRGRPGMEGFTLDADTPADLAARVDIPGYWWDDIELPSSPGSVAAWPDEHGDGFDDLLVHLGGRVRLVPGSNADVLRVSDGEIIMPPVCAFPTEFVEMGGVGAITEPGRRQLLVSSPDAALDQLSRAGRVFAVDW